ncbi:hypothetical protein EDD63_12314 [Breznakia blatticola]|uniref:Uncharacterized protein n=1 Tax=Breznakia blatticola TaxID=1754012 RepID=A0A4R7ZFP5_9FIRM|nr:hypothetical protein [Breznakia blatticola]TDW16457.1 hypothetical protein EDD63_12314 [Breznakia blatticola]
MKRLDKVKMHLKLATSCSVTNDFHSLQIHEVEINNQGIYFAYDCKEDIEKFSNEDDVHVHAIYNHNELTMHGKLQYIDDTKTTFCLIQVRASFYISGKLAFTYDFRDIA